MRVSDPGAVWAVPDPRELALRIRLRAVRMIAPQGFGYLGQALSSAEQVAAVFACARPGVDRIVCSPGHYVIGPFAAAAELGLIDVSGYGQNGSAFEAIGTERSPVMDYTCGSLGQGLSAALGFALADRLRGSDERIFTMVSDGELEEGQVWEAALFAAHHRLDRLTVLLDANNSQVDGPVDSITTLEPIAAKWSAFGWHAADVDGHDVDAVCAALAAAGAHRGQPNVLVCRTSTRHGRVNAGRAFAPGHRRRGADAGAAQHDGGGRRRRGRDPPGTGCLRPRSSRRSGRRWARPGLRQMCLLVTLRRAGSMRRSERRLGAASAPAVWGACGSGPICWGLCITGPNRRRIPAGVRTPLLYDRPAVRGLPGRLRMSLQEFVPTPRFDEYRETFKDFYRMERRDDGVLLVAAHTLGGPVQLSVQNHRSLGQMLKTVGADPANEVLILTGSGSEFMMSSDPEGFALEEEDMEYWAYEYAYKDGRINVSALVNDVEIPTIGLLNGPGFHSEIVLMCDITLAAEDAVLFDLHYDIGSVPADGINNAFQELLGVKRAAYALLTGEAISARQALEWGMVNEVVPRDRLIERAYQIADHIMTQPRTVRRLTTQIVRRPWKQRIVSDLDGGFGIQMFGHIAKKRAVHGEAHIRSTVDYVREGRKNNFD